MQSFCRLGWSLLSCLLLSLLLSDESVAQQLAFPTAEGYGRHTLGGRGGRVIKVTTLADDLPAPAGSLRACVENTGARTCVFEVGGTITLVDHLTLYDTNSYLTIAGQTALGEGVIITPYPLDIVYGAQHVIIRHLRHRQGYPTVPPDFNNDCGAFMAWGDSSLGESTWRVKNVMLDHVSAGYPCDDAYQAYGLVSGMTIQWSIVADPYADGEWGGSDPYGQPKSLISGSGHMLNNFLTYHHNFSAHAATRSPNAGSLNVLDFRHNVIYNPKYFSGAVDLGVTNNFAYTSLPLNVNFVGNKYLFPTAVAPSCCVLGNVMPYTQTKIYVQNNQTPWCPGTPNCAASEWNLGWKDPTTGLSPPPEATYRVLTPFTAPPVTATPLAQLDTVLQGTNGVGATKPQRDSLDVRVLNEWQTRTGDIGRNAAPFPTLPTVGSGSAPADTDQDGIPNTWETAHGLNPNSASDGPAIVSSGPNQGYSNLEVYLNELAGDTAPTSQPPVVTILVPTSASTYTTSTSPLPTLSGTVTDNGSVVSMTVSCTTCIQPLPSVTLTAPNWSVSNIGFGVGSHLLEVTATDNEGLTDEAQLTVTLSPPAVGNANPVYVNQATGNDTRDCATAEAPSTPKATIMSGLTCLTYAGKVLRVYPGTYTEVVDTALHPITAGGPTAYTRIEGVGQGVVLAAPGGQGLALWLRGSLSYVEFSNFVVDGLSRPNTNAASLHDGVHHIRFMNMTFRNSGPNYECVYAVDADQLEFLATTFSSCGHDGLSLNGTMDGVLVTGSTFTGMGEMGIRAHVSSGTSTNLILTKNTLSQTGQSNATVPALGLGAGTNALVSNNVLYSNKHGIRVYTGHTGARVYNNTVTDNTPGVGLQCDSGASGALIANNISFANGTDPITNTCGGTLTANRTSDPLFTNAPARDYTLQSGSPALNVGTTLTAVPDDRLSIPRPQGAAYDQGAYERLVPLPSGIRGDLLQQFTGWFF